MFMRMEVSMLKLFVTMFRGRSQDAAEAIVDANSVPILRQQLRDCAQSVELGRKSVAMVMACCEREKKSAEQIALQLGDLEARAKEALQKGREDLAVEAAGAIAHLEAERDTTDRAIATYQTEITRLRKVLTESESRLRALQRGQRLALATEHTQRLHKKGPVTMTAGLSDAEATLNRIQDRQAMAAATRDAAVALSAQTSADATRDRLAAAGCGAPLRPDAAAVLARLKQAPAANLPLAP
jgi:phage shock protein A